MHARAKEESLAAAEREKKDYLAFPETTTVRFLCCLNKADAMCHGVRGLIIILIICITIMIIIIIIIIINY